MWTVIFGVATAICLLCSLGALLFAARAVRLAMELRQHWQQSATSSGAALSQRMDEAEETLKVIANRLKMMKVRGAANHVRRDNGDEPDPRSDPEGWRAWKNSQLRAGQFNQ